MILPSQDFSRNLRVSLSPEDRASAPPPYSGTFAKSRWLVSVFLLGEYWFKKRYLYHIEKTLDRSPENVTLPWICWDSLGNWWCLFSSTVSDLCFSLESVVRWVHALGRSVVEVRSLTFTSVVEMWPSQVLYFNYWAKDQEPVIQCLSSDLKAVLSLRSVITHQPFCTCFGVVCRSD